MGKLLIISTLLIIATSTLVCGPGFVLSSQALCVSPRYIEGCSQYLNEFTCKSCIYRYDLLDSGLCSINTSPKEDCCSVRGANGVCKTCQNGLYLIDGKCQQSNILGCLEKSTVGTCINCALGFNLQNGKCIQVIKNCLKFTDNTNTVCTDCAADYSLIKNLCVKNSILGCKVEQNKECNECYKPFALNNGNCQIRNCKTYDQYRCVACECGYYLNEQGQCTRMDTGCVRYRRGVCIDCLPRFRLKGNSCQIEGCLKLNNLQCSLCNSDYTLVKGSCKMNNCVSWKDGQCQICEQGYNFKLGKCIAKTSTSTK